MKDEGNDPRSRLARRLTAELGDPAAVVAAVEHLDQGVLDLVLAAIGGDIEASPVLSSELRRVLDEEVDSLWLFSWGFRIDPRSGRAAVELLDEPPPMADLEPGPVNAEIARVAAGFVERYPVPVIAQWEIAGELERLGVPDVAAVEPEIGPDGSTVYLSTPDVIEVGRRLATERGWAVRRAGVITFQSLAVGSLLAMSHAGLDAGVPAGVELPSTFDTESGQLWTRSLEAWLPVDLFGRAIFGADT